MITMEVSLNGKRVCIAGAEDLSVLSAVVSAVGKLGKLTLPTHPVDRGPDLYYSVGGLSARKHPRADVHLNWTGIAPLSIGDVIVIRLRECRIADKAKKRTRARRGVARKRDA